MSSILFYSTGKTQSWTELASAGPWRAKRGTLSEFSTILSQNVKKIAGDPLNSLNFFRKASQCRNLEEGPFSLARYCMLRGKRKNLFGSGQMLQFDNKISNF